MEIFDTPKDQYTKPKKLLAIDTNAKTVKGQKKGFMTGILYLSPVDLSGYQVCPQASKGCAAACLNTAGRGSFTNVQQSRLNKTRWYFNDRETFMAQLVKDIEGLIRKADREGFTPVVRLNGTSDIPWERVMVPVDGKGSIYQGHTAHWPNIMVMFPNVQFYDYTKITKRALAHARGEMPANYHLTFSATESNDADCFKVLGVGGNVAMVFADIPETYVYGPRSAHDNVIVSYPVINGDATDLRFTDRDSDDLPQGYASTQHSGVIVALKAKGKARKDTSGFVR